MNFSNLLDEMLTLPDGKRSEAKQIIPAKRQSNKVGSRGGLLKNLRCPFFQETQSIFVPQNVGEMWGIHWNMQVLAVPVDICEHGENPWAMILRSWTCISHSMNRMPHPQATFVPAVPSLLPSFQDQTFQNNSKSKHLKTAKQTFAQRLMKIVHILST